MLEHLVCRGGQYCEIQSEPTLGEPYVAVQWREEFAHMVRFNGAWCQFGNEILTLERGPCRVATAAAAAFP